MSDSISGTSLPIGYLDGLFYGNLSIIGSPLTDEPEAIILNLNMLLYVVLFLVILGLFLRSLVRSRMGAGRSREDTSIPEGRYAEPEKEPEDKGE